MKTTIDALVEALEQSTELLVRIVEGKEWGAIEEYIDEARAALAQARAEQAEPVNPYLYLYEFDTVVGLHQSLTPNWNGCMPNRTIPLYTTPPAAPVAKLEPLKLNELKRILQETAEGIDAGHIVMTHWEIVARAIEAAHNAKLGNK